MSIYPEKTFKGARRAGAKAAPVFKAGLHKYLATVAAPGATAIHAAINAPASGTTSVKTAITNPDWPRSVTVVGNAAGQNGNVVINGTNAAGAIISETLTLNGTTSVESSKAFKTVTEIVVPTRNAAGDTVSVGTGSKLGLAHVLPVNTVQFASRNGTIEGTAPTVNVAANVESNTVKLNSALNGTPISFFYYA